MTTRPAARRLAATGALALALLLGACGGDATDEAADQASTAPSADSSTPASEQTEPTEPTEPAEPAPSSEPAEEGTVVEVTIEGGQVSPTGERVPVAVGEPVTFRITSDVEGEVHVHSVPESEFTFGPGSTEQTVTVETPGLVEVELHDPEVTLVQLEAR